MATTAEKRENLVVLRAKAEEKVREYNAAVLENKGTRSIEEELTNTVNEYTSVARSICFDECRDSDDPMMTAVQRLTFDTIATHPEKVEGASFSLMTIIDKEQPIDLGKLHKYCGGIGADTAWLNMLEKFNFHMTAKRAIRLGINPANINDSYAMSEISKAIDLGENPVDDDHILDTMQAIVTAMVGPEYTNAITPYDVAYLDSIYAKKVGKRALAVGVANHAHLRSYMAEICHRAVMGKSYAIEYKTKK